MGAHGQAGSDDEMVRRVLGRHLRAMIAVASVYEKNPCDVEELLADVLTLVHRHRDLLAEWPDDRLRAWVLNTTRNVCRNHVRRTMTRRRLSAKLSLERPVSVASPEDEWLAAEQRAAENLDTERMLNALADLSAHYREVLQLNALGESSAAIAAVFGLSPGGVRNRLFKARTALRDRYGQLGVPAVGATTERGEVHDDD